MNYKHIIIGICMLLITLYTAMAIDYDITNQPDNLNMKLGINMSSPICPNTIWVNPFIYGNISLNFTDCDNFTITNATNFNVPYELEGIEIADIDNNAKYMHHFGINASDSSGNAPDSVITTSGAIYHNNSVNSSFCKHTGCYEINGTSSGIFIQSSPVTKNLTSCLWVRHNTMANSLERIWIDNWISVTNHILRLTTSNKAELITKDGGTTRVTTGTSTLTANNWYHICGTYDYIDNVARIYVNGIQEANTTHTSGGRVFSGENVYIGSNNGGSNRLNATVDDVRIYDTYFDDIGIQTLYNNTFGDYLILKEIYEDVTPPNVTVVSPINDTYNYTTIPLNVYADEPIDTWWYILNNGSETIFTPNTTINASNGSNEITVFANDTSGNVNNGSIVFFASDTDDPDVTIYSPVNTTYDAPILNLEVSANENITAWWYNLNYGVDVEFTPNTTINATEGQNALFVYANDSVLNTGFNSVFFVVDTTPPTFTIDQPQNTTYINVTTVNLNVNYTEQTAIFSYSLNGADFVLFTPNTTINVINGSNSLTVRANDTLNNYADQTVYFNAVYPPPAEPEPSFTGYSFINLEDTSGVLLLGILVFFFLGLWVIGFQFKNFGFCSMAYIVGFFLGFLFFNIHWILTGMMFLLNTSIFIFSAKMVK